MYLPSISIQDSHLRAKYRGIFSCFVLYDMNFQKKSDTFAYIQHIARRVKLSICRKYKIRFCCKWSALKLMLIKHFFDALDKNYRLLKFQVFL